MIKTIVSAPNVTYGQAIELAEKFVANKAGMTYSVQESPLTGVRLIVTAPTTYEERLARVAPRILLVQCNPLGKTGYDEAETLRKMETAWSM